MLNKWIEDSESKIIPMKSKKDEEDEKEKESSTVIKKSEGNFDTQRTIYIYKSKWYMMKS